MPKWGIGLLTGAVLIGLLLIFLGRALYPHLSQTFHIAGVVVAGLLTGGGTGLFLHLRETAIGGGLLWGGLVGILCFALLSLGQHLPAVPTILVGAGEGALSGLIVQIWPLIDRPPAG